MSDLSVRDGKAPVITAIGAVTAVGGSAEESGAAINAGITPFAEHSYYGCIPEDPDWDEDLPAYVAAVPFIESHLNSADRFTKLAIPSLTEVFANSQLKRRSLAKTGLFMALPVVEKSLQETTLNGQWLKDLLVQTGLNGIKSSQVIRGGNVGMFTLINEAIVLLQNGQLEQCIVGGVDSYLLQSRMTYFDQLWRVKSSRNVDGFIPGEASIMIMLETYDCAIARGAEILAKIGGIGFGVEKNNFYSDKASSGQGITQSIRAALKDQTGVQANWIGCDLSGESYYSQELGLIHTRLSNRFSSNTEISHPADCCGNVGAASGGLLIVDSVEKMRQQPDEAQNILLSTANDDGRRSALLLQSRS